MEASSRPIYMVSLGRVYRRDTPDAKHTPIFHQVEGLAVDQGITLADLEGHAGLPAARALRRGAPHVRFRTSFFPFTEPSVEADVSCFTSAAEPAAACASTRAGSRSAAPGSSTRTCSSSSATTPRGLRLRLRLGPRADRHAPARAARHPRCSGRTTSGFSSSSDERSRSPGCASTSTSTYPPTSSLERLTISTLEVERVVRRASPTTNGNSGSSGSASVVEAGKHPNADRLQLCRVDVGEGEPRQIVCGAWNFGAGATVAVGAARSVPPGADEPLGEAKLRGELSAG